MGGGVRREEVQESGEEEVHTFLAEDDVRGKDWKGRGGGERERERENA